MLLHPGWQAITLRLALTVLAGSLLGLDRSRHGHPAGLRTTLLVTLAASVAMIQMNLLLSTNGKPASSYAVMDVMRLPLGILTGVGFIGAGAIVRRDDLVIGVTTAATMWFATVVGLCLGGGQIILGCVSTVLGCIVLWNLKWFESRLNRKQRAALIVTAKSGGLNEEALRSLLTASGISIKTFAITRSIPEQLETFEYEVLWIPTATHGDPPSAIQQIERTPGLVTLQWKPAGAPPG